MHHDPYERYLKAWIDGELGSEKRRELEQHLSVCAACAERAEDFRRLSSLISRAERPIAPCPPVRRIRDLVDGRRRDEDRFVRLLQRAAATAAFVALTTVLAGALSSPPSYRDDAMSAAFDETAAAAVRSYVDPEYALLSVPPGQPLDLKTVLDVEED